MAYVAVKGGASAIEASIEALKYERLKGGYSADVQVIEHTMRQLIDQVMSESSLYDRPLTALALKQAEGNMEEAVFLLRAYRSTLPRFGVTQIIEPETMEVHRRISASFKDIVGGQMLGATPDYTHRLLDSNLIEETDKTAKEWVTDYLDSFQGDEEAVFTYPKVITHLREEGLFYAYEKDETPPKDVTMTSLSFPTVRSERLQVLTRGQTGAVTALGYAAIRGYGATHPTVGELRVGLLPLYVSDLQAEDNQDESYYIGSIQVTEVESFIPKEESSEQENVQLQFDVGYGICFGQNETKAIAMSILDESLERTEAKYPTNDEEFVLLHIDSVESSGFISHLKLPHYVTFQSKLDRIRRKKEEKE